MVCAGSKHRSHPTRPGIADPHTRRRPVYSHPLALRFAHNVIDGNVNTVWHDDIVDSIVATALYDLD